MAIGQPLLLVWRKVENTLRLFQFNETAGFVQLATTALQHDATTAKLDKPTIAFVTEKNVVFLAYYRASPSATVFALRSSETLNLLTSKTSTELISYPMEFAKGQTIEEPSTGFAKSRGNKALVIVVKPSSTFVTPTIDMEGTPSLELDAVIAMPNFNGQSRAVIAVHPSNKYVFAGDYPSRLGVFDPSQADYPDYKYPFFKDFVVQDAVRTRIILAEWSIDGRFLYTADTIDAISIYKVESDKLVLVNTVEGSALITKIIPCFDNQRVAVSRNDNGAYSTTIYERRGQNLQVVQTIANFGKGLDWSADGRLLVDALGKRLFRWDVATSRFVENASLISNIPANSDMQALSSHRSASHIAGLVYAPALNKLVENLANVDTNNLRAFIYSNALPAFDTETLNDSAYKVMGGWHPSGKKLANVKLDEINFTADTLKQVFLESSAFRYIVVKDVTNDIPILFLDLGEDMTVGQYQQFNVDFTGGLISFST